MSEHATNNMLRSTQAVIRSHMNEVTDHMATGACKDMSEYVGVRDY